MRTLQEIAQRRAELKNEVATRSAEMSLEDINKINEELNQLDAEEAQIRAMQELDKRVAGMATPVVEREKKGETTQALSPEQVKQRAKQKRGALYKGRTGVAVELRAAGDVSGTSGQGVLIPSHQSSVVAPYPWNEVSSIVDLVETVDLPNGSEYTESFQIETGEGAYTLEATKVGENADGKYAEVETKFDQVTIKRNKITALTYLSEELQSIPEANYADLVESNVSLSIKKKLAKEIMLGDGTSSHFVGLLCAPGSNLNTNTYTDMEKDIDENTIFDITVDFGGTEDVESRQVLVMNKQTLKDFKKIRGTDKRPVYDITITGNTFTIDGYRGVFSSHIKPYSTATEGEYWCVYGDLSKYKVLNFGGETIETSREFKFDQGITAARGKVWSGGGLCGYKGFLRLKKPAAAKASSTSQTSKL